MDEDDSQDELINRSSKNKGKRAAAWTISDNSDEAGSDEDVVSQSGDEDEEEEPLDDDDEEEDEDEEEEEYGEEVEPKEEEACAGTSADAEVSSDEEAEKCPICLHSFNRQPVATPENCAHYFCLDCILEWSKNANSCPIDRTNFKVIYLRTCFGGKVQKVITIQKPAKQCEQDTVDVDLEETSCEVCGGSDREDRLLLCDGCDAGYHMDCLTPPLDAVPVEEWFCPECEANNRQSRASAAETSDTDSLPSTARLPASSRARSQVGQTRAIARTQHSERVRANVNRHRITQARTQELAPTYLIRSTWLDETINAVVAGLNTAVYVRDLTSRPSSTRRRKSRKVNGRKKSKSKNGKAASTGIKRRKRRVRRTKSRKRLVMKTPTPRSRIANNLGIVKDKKSSSLPTVYRPSESTLSNMRADIGAASLSIYGDPFDLDPFTDREEEEQTHDSVLFEAKRRGISRSAFRSHQPVARPVSLSRRSVSIPQASGVVEAAPVPDLLGSILSGQSMLLMDSSDVVINRDGSLKASKPLSLTNRIRSGSSRSSSSGDGGPQTSPGEPPDHMDRLGFSEGPLNTHFSQSSSPLYLGSPLNSSEISSSHVPPRGNAFSHELNRPNQRLGHPITNGVRECRDNCSSESKAFSQSHSLKAPTKPMWIDVSVLPRIPKIKRENSVDTSVKNDNNGDKMNGSSNGSSSGMPETGINRLAGDKERRHSVDQQDGRTEGQRSRPEGAGSSSGFSSSFSSSSSSSPAASHTNHQRFSSGSSSSSSVSFRISSSGNSWHSRRLNIAPLTPSGSTPQEQRTKKDEEERRRQLRRDKQKLLASRSKDSHGIYDPFNPTESDSGSSDGESGSINVECSSRFKQEPANLKKKVSSRSRWDLKQVKVETQRPHSEDKPTTTTAQETGTQQVKGTKENATFKKGSIFSHITPSETAVEKDPESDTDESVKNVLESETEDETQPVEQRLHPIKTEETLTEEPAPEPPTALCDVRASAAFNSSPVKKWDVADDRASASATSNSSLVKKWDVADDRASATSNSSPIKELDVADDRASASATSNSSPVKKWDVADDRASATSNSSPIKELDGANNRASATSNSSPVNRWDVADDRASASATSSPVKKWDVADVRASATSNTSPVKKWDVAADRASSTANSSPIKELEKTEIKSESHNNQSKDAISEKSAYKKKAPSKDQRMHSSSTERTKKQGSSDQDRRHVRAEAKHEGSDREKDKAKSSRRSRSKERRTHRASDSSLSKSPEKTSKKSRRSRSRSKDRRRSRSYSTSSSRERSRTKKHKKQSKERNEDKDLKRRSSKDKRRDRSRSKSRSKSRSRSRSRDRRRARSRSRSRSRSRDRRKTESRHQSSRDKVESRSKDGKRHRSRSGSREKKKMKEDLPQVKTQKLAETRRSSDKNKKPLKEKRKEDTCTVKAEKVSKTNNPASTSSSVVKNESTELKVEEKPFEVVDKQDKTKKEIKKDKYAVLDMFEGSPTDNIIKTEHVDTPITVCEDRCWEDTHSINTEVYKSDQLEPKSPEKKPIVSDCSIDDDIHSAAVSTPLHDPPDHSTEGPTNSIKQEAFHQSSDSEDDFNVDVMLDNLDLVKSKFDEPTEAAVKQEKDEKSEGEPAAAGPKSKTQVKRVTWNIEEPVGPQPDKSSSKVALYKLKLKQEGIRRPSSSTSSLDLTVTTSDGDLSKSTDLERSSGSDSSQGLSAQGQSDDGDLLKKDTTYIKKLHMQERAIEEVKLAIKPFYQKRDISKDEYKDIVRKAVQKVCHSKSGEINPVKVGNLVKAYVDKYKHARKYKKGDEPGKSQESLSP